MELTIAFISAALLLAATPLCRSQSEPRPIVEHLGMLLWADEVSNFQVRALQGSFPREHSEQGVQKYPNRLPA